MKLEITKEKVLKASKRCEQTREILEDMFPEAFEKKGREDITEDIDWAMYEFCTENYWLMGTYGYEEICYFDSTGFHFNHKDYEDDYEFEIRNRDNAFRILKKT